jgi:transposase
MLLYGGIDLHANNSVVVLLTDQDQVIYQKRLPNHLPTILAPLSLHHGEIEGVVVESTYNWYWLVDGLLEAGYRVHLANPAAMQQYNGLKYTDDHSDARWLAHLLRLGVLPEGYIYPKAERAVRDLLRKRAHLVRQHTANGLSVQNIMARNTGARFSVKRIHELRLSDSFGEINGAIPSSFVDSAFMVSMATPEHIEIPALCSGSYSGSHRHSCKRRSTHQAGAA